MSVNSEKLKQAAVLTRNYRCSPEGQWFAEYAWGQFVESAQGSTADAAKDAAFRALFLRVSDVATRLVGVSDEWTPGDCR